MSVAPRQAVLLSPVLEEHVMELVDCMGFHLLSHIPEQAAHLRLGDAELVLRQDPGNTEATAGAANKGVRLWVWEFFEIYAVLARKLRHRLSGPPRLSIHGEWEFSVPDSFGHTLHFSMASHDQNQPLASTTYDDSVSQQNGARP